MTGSGLGHVLRAGILALLLLACLAIALMHEPVPATPQSDVEMLAGTVSDRMLLNERQRLECVLTGGTAIDVGGRHVVLINPPEEYYLDKDGEML